jgi:hypothetical protein
MWGRDSHKMVSGVPGAVHSGKGGAVQDLRNNSGVG